MDLTVNAGPLLPTLMAVPLDSEAFPMPEYFLSNYPNVTKIVFATALGILLGTEREWSQKPAGIRTFTILTILGTVLTIVGNSILVVIGALLVVVQGSTFAVRGALVDDENYMLTTSVSMFLAYAVGILIGNGAYFEGVLVTVLTALLLVLRRELHGFARNLSKDEIWSATEFAAIAFIVFPLLPRETFGPGGVVDLRTAWLLVVAVSALGFANYLIVQQYGTRGLAITSFFGGLVNSAAVVGAIVARSRIEPRLANIAVGGVLLANAAMAFRDMLIVVAFIPDIGSVVVVPLGAITVTGIALSYVVSDWDVEFELESTSPFKLSNAMKFGAVFLLFLIVSASLRATYGPSGFLLSSFFGGLVSSGAVMTSVVLLVQSGQLTDVVAVWGIVAAVSASILMKLGLAITMNRSLYRPVTLATAALIGVGVLAGIASSLLPF